MLSVQNPSYILIGKLTGCSAAMRENADPGKNAAAGELRLWEGGRRGEYTSAVREVLQVVWLIIIAIIFNNISIIIAMLVKKVRFGEYTNTANMGPTSWVSNSLIVFCLEI